MSQNFKEMSIDIDEIQGPDTITFITTNGTIKKNGSGVMGAGVALYYANKYPSGPKRLGEILKKYGNVPAFLDPGSIPRTEFWTFPVKNNWFEPASLSLIEKSAMIIRPLVTTGKMIVLPRPGCGNGHRDWNSEVKPIILKYLNYNNVLIINK